MLIMFIVVSYFLAVALQWIMDKNRDESLRETRTSTGYTRVAES